MKKIFTLHKKISSGAKSTLSKMREKPYETRKQIIVFLTGFFMIILIIGWIAVLKNQLQATTNETQDNTINPTDLIREDINRVYNSANEIITDDQFLN